MKFLGVTILQGGGGEFPLFLLIFEWALQQCSANALPVILSLHCFCFVGKVTFVDFAQYVIDTWSSGKRLDVHWRPQHQICNPCYIDYDFIGHFENVDDDAKHVLAKLIRSGGPGSNVTFPISNTHSGKTVSLSRKLKSLYADVPNDIVRKLIRIYKYDYELFGYDYLWACNRC